MLAVVVASHVDAKWSIVIALDASEQTDLVVVRVVEEQGVVIRQHFVAFRTFPSCQVQVIA